MSEDRKNTPETALKDEEMDNVSGGVCRRSQDEKQVQCTICKGLFPEYQLQGGYCGKCLEELHAQGVFPPI